MECLQLEIEKLLNVITVVLWNLNEIENEVVADIRMILFDSKNEVIQIQQSIIAKYKENQFKDQENIAAFDADVKQEEAEVNNLAKSEISPKECDSSELDSIVAEVDAYLEHENDSFIKSEEENDRSTIKISYKKNSQNIEREPSGKKKGNIIHCQQCEYSTTRSNNMKRHSERKHNNIFISRAITCHLCGFVAKSKVSLRRHIELKHFAPRDQENIVALDADIKSSSDVKQEDVNSIAKSEITPNGCDFSELDSKEVDASLNNTHENDNFSEPGEDNDRSTINMSYKKNSKSREKEPKKKKKPRKLHCQLCEYTTTLSFNMRRHIEFKHNISGSATCHLCGFVAKSKANLKGHIRLKHFAPEGQTKCEKCLKCFPNEKFDGHLCEVKNFICYSCGKAYTTKYGLDRHIMIEHENVQFPKPFICDKCDFCCESKSALQKHMVTHEEKKPCPECGERVRNIKSHMVSMHTPDEMKKYQCQDCGKGFNEPYNLEAHRMNVHLKLRPYNCRYGCDISYNDTSNRNAHEKKTHGKLFTTVKEEKLKALMQL